MSQSIAIHSSFTLTGDDLLKLGYQIPSGTTTQYSGATAPVGWMMCDGSSLVRADFPALFGAIGTAHGAADATHFNIPDARGRFVRGVDGTAGRDPDVSGRFAGNAGGNTGNAVGSCQNDQFLTHVHGIPTYNSATGQPLGNNNFGGTNLSNIGNTNTTANGGNETRPVNIALNYIIKY